MEQRQAWLAAQGTAIAGQDCCWFKALWYDGWTAV